MSNSLTTLSDVELRGVDEASPQLAAAHDFATAAAPGVRASFTCPEERSPSSYGDVLGLVHRGSAQVLVG